MSYRFKRAYKRQSIKLMLYQWVALSYIAAAVESRALRGTRKGKQSWRTMVRRIAEGELIVLQKADLSPALPAKKAA